MKKCLLFLFTCALSPCLWAQADLTPPALACLHNQTVFVGPTCDYTLFDSDFIDVGTDFENFTVQFGIRKSCAGLGFPLNQHILRFSAAEYGENTIELWARDSVGNTSVCQTQIFVNVDNTGCETLGATQVIVETPIDSGILQTRLRVESGNCMGDSSVTDYITLKINGPDGRSSGGVKAVNVREAYGTSIIPAKDINPLNGVTTNDLLLIQKHILGVEPLNTAYKLIAADANMDGKVTTFDIVLLRKLMMGIIPKLPHEKSWRFIPKDYVFPNPQHPFVPAFPETIVVPEYMPGPIPYLYFIGVKIGDVNNSADPNN